MGMKLPSINYSIPLANLYWNIIKSSIEQSTNLSFLSDVVGPNQCRGVPSWMPHFHGGSGAGERAQSMVNLQLPPEITYKATGDTYPFCYFNSRLKALRVAGFASARVKQTGGMIEYSLISSKKAVASAAPTNPNTVVSANIEKMNRIIRKWVSMLDIEDTFTGPLLQIDEHYPDGEKKQKAIAFMRMIIMVDEVDASPLDKLFRTYKNVQEPSSTHLFLNVS
jgi:hypothetical protein